MENAPFRKSVADMQISQEMISPENTKRDRNHEVGIGTLLTNITEMTILSHRISQDEQLVFGLKNLSLQYQVNLLIMWISTFYFSLKSNHPYQRFSPEG